MEYPSPQHERAVSLLKLCYQAIDADYRQRYRMDLWRQIEARVRLAGTTSGTLAQWAQRFLSFPHTELRDPAAAAAIIASGEDRAILRIYREEPGVVVTFLRAVVEEERAAREAVTA